MHPEDVAVLANRMADEIERVIIGKGDVVRRVLVGLLAGGHVLIEDIPGVGKTMLARSTAKVIGGVFHRIQFTPDLLPADITGISIYNQRTQEFSFRPGPVFANVLLADEINRATPKLQSALLESMDERQVTVEGVSHRLPDPFLVIATENPIEFRGTHPLPETQLDRFLLRIDVGYPSRDAEVEILKRQRTAHPIEAVEAVTSPEEMIEARIAVRQVHIDSAIQEYIVRLVEATRTHPEVILGASPRGSLALQHAAQAVAAMQGRDYVIPDDVKGIAVACLGHRVITGGGGSDGVRGLLAGMLEDVPVPEVSAR
ncbi:MAG: MoxR family ATPase [Acidobacteriota bacterium]|nr:MoxR family ATPase [Acidobacteriota bacterium]